MKKKINILYLFFMLFLVLFSRITKDNDILLLVLSSSLSILIYNTFSNINITSTLNKYKNKYKVYKIISIFISLIFIIFALLSYLFGNIINVDNLGLINFVSIIFTLTILLIKIISLYLERTKYKKLGNKLLNLYLLLIVFISGITVIFLYKVFNLEDYINILILYSVNIIIFIIILLLISILIFRKNKVSIKEKYNYKQIVKELFNIDQNIVIYNIIKEGYIYTSIIILYYVLLNKYNYTYDNVIIIITNTYFYGIFLIKYINYLIKKYLSFDYNNYTNQIIKIINYLLSICLLLMVISGPLTRLLFNTSNYLFDLMILLFFYVLYDYIINTSIKICNTRINKIILLSGLIIKVIFELPLINANYRMGYSLSFGSILSMILGMLISIIISIIFINRKLKFNILDNFNNILNIIYENIILCLILVLFTLIVKVDTNSVISSFLVIIFYIFITIIFNVIKKIIKK